MKSTTSMKKLSSFSLALVFLFFALHSMGTAGAHGLRKVKTEGSHVYYEGSVIVSGAYHQQVRESEIGNYVAGLICFSVHGSTARLIPREKDSRSPWFCFSNAHTARTALKIPTEAPGGACIIYGKATVQISKYVVNRNESEVHDIAFLDKVISFDKPTFRKKCSIVP